MTVAVPRIRGRVGTITEPSEEAGKLAYEISIWDLTGTQQLFEPFVFGPFENEDAAKSFGREKVQEVSRALAEAENGNPDLYLDMKNGGELRSWVVH